MSPGTGLPTVAATDRDLDRSLIPGPPSRRYWSAVAALGLLALAGWGTIVALAASGPEPRAKWGYPAAALAFLLSTAQAAPLLAFAARLAKGHWGVPLHRAAELYSSAGLVTAPLLIVLLFQLPAWEGRPSLWFGWPGAPQLWDSLAVLLLAACGLALLYVTSLPDLAAARDGRGGAPSAGSGAAAGAGRGQALGRLGLARGRLGVPWRGTRRQWAVLPRGLTLLGGLYLMLFTFVHLLVSSDLALSLVPGWRSAIVPPYHAVSGLEGGVAAALLALAALRRFAGLDRFTGRDPFRAAAKILLALALLWFYFVWADFLPFWYGRTPAEQRSLALFMFGPYFWPFLFAFGLSFLLPALLLMWNPIRGGVAGPTAAAALALAGLFFDRVRLYVPAWSLAGPVTERLEHLEHLPPTQYPGWADVLVLVGMPASVGLLYLLALRLVPPISLWEHTAARSLRAERPYLRTLVPVIARPDQ